MTLNEMIEILQAAQRGEPIEYKSKHYPNDRWIPKNHDAWNTDTFDYRIAPKKELSLVEELREEKFVSDHLRRRAADRIEELESHAANWAPMLTTDQLLDEIKRRMSE
jgi:hypothetical protein